jgi:hypothetical protein
MSADILLGMPVAVSAALPTPTLFKTQKRRSWFIGDHFIGFDGTYRTFSINILSAAIQGRQRRLIHGFQFILVTLKRLKYIFNGGLDWREKHIKPRKCLRNY